MPTKKKAPPKKRASTTAGTGVRLEDVARIAGVTSMTVSRVVNTPGRVSTETRARVLKAIAKVGYVPNLTASSLATKRSRIVAALVPTLGNSFFAETVRGLSETLAAEGYQLLLGQTGYDAKSEDALVAALLGRGVDGIVLTGVAHPKAVVKRLKRAGIPVVETWDLTRTPIDMVAGFSNFKAGGGVGDRTRSRLDGFKAAAKEVPGASVAQVILPIATSFSSGREAVIRMREENPRVEAIFFVNDAMAVGALMECQRRGVRVPLDLAIVGFTDIDIAAEIEPGLTTVQVRSRNIGEEAGRMLLARFRGEKIDEPIRDLGFALVARASA
jgi:LacI family gluconate utilization system Gnt-I transcriptional repressor